MFFALQELNLNSFFVKIKPFVNKRVFHSNCFNNIRSFIRAHKFRVTGLSTGIKLVILVFTYIKRKKL
jgi:hypothetical protein